MEHSARRCLPAGAGKNSPGKNGPGKNGPGKNGPAEKTVLSLMVCAVIRVCLVSNQLPFVTAHNKTSIKSIFLARGRRRRV